ncbi:unnamed protein product [Peniophora sp. CBMAI 1063]|nr:unnamed protein product [Peniophora sp. CBMAI 1063]
MSNYHWKQTLDLQMRQINEERYASSATFIYNNIRQALKILAKYPPEVWVFMEANDITEAAFPIWLRAELKFLVTAHANKEPQEQANRVSYAEALHRYWAQQDKVSETFAKSQAKPRNHDVRKAKKALPALQKHLNALHEPVLQWEMLLDILPNDRWTTTSDAYVAMATYMTRKSFICAAETLHGAVISRLMEISKLNTSGLGHKLRNHISQALGCRSRTLRNNVDAYNKLVLKYGEKAIKYEDIIKMTNTAAFDLVVAGSQDIRKEAWARAGSHEAADKWWKVQGAKHELERCYVEVHRLQAWVDHEDRAMLDAVRASSETNPAFAHHLNGKIYTLPGHRGPQHPSNATPAIKRCITQPFTDNQEDSRAGTIRPYALRAASPSAGSSDADEDEDEGSGSDADDEDQFEGIAPLGEWLSNQCDIVREPLP